MVNEKKSIYYSLHITTKQSKILLPVGTASHPMASMHAMSIANHSIASMNATSIASHPMASMDAMSVVSHPMASMDPTSIASHPVAGMDVVLELCCCVALTGQLYEATSTLYKGIKATDWGGNWNHFQV